MPNRFPRDAFIKKAKGKEHSRDFITEALSYARNLESRGLPVIFSRKHLALLLNMSYDELTDIILNRSAYYNHFKIRKKRGGVRFISTPAQPLKRIQRILLADLLSAVELHEKCIGFRRGYSIKKHAENHAHADVVFSLDLYRFFDSICERRVFGMFKEIGYAANLAVDLAKIATVQWPWNALQELNGEKHKPSDFTISGCVLPQGAPTSPVISNIIARRLDVRLDALASKVGASYSRYADDIVFSGSYGSIPSVNTVGRIVSEEGFFINKTKVRRAKKGTRQLITGLTVSNGVHVQKSYKKDVSRHLYYCSKYGVNSHLEKISMTKSNYKDWLLGRIMFIRSIEPEVGDTFIRRFDEISWLL